MTVTLYADVAHYQSGLRLSGLAACIAKATEGTGEVDPAYHGFRDQATALGIPFGAYHYLLGGVDAGAQARHCFSVVGRGVPLMIDDEDPVSRFSMSHTLAFATEYRRIGGTVTLEYLPHHYWEASGSPDLRPLERAGLAIVASWYGQGYGDSAPGWKPYGGVAPAVLQFTSSYHFGGQSIDMNAYRGTIDQFRTLLFGGANMTTVQIDLAQPLNDQGLTIRNALVSTYLRSLPDLASRLDGVLAAAHNDSETPVSVPDAFRAQLVADLLAALPTAPIGEIGVAAIATAVCDELARRVAG